jgi:hypothetical protein
MHRKMAEISLYERISNRTRPYPLSWSTMFHSSVVVPLEKDPAQRFWFSSSARDRLAG